MSRKTSGLNVRHEQIVETVAATGEVLAQSLARQFNVSLVTIRRDLLLLEEEGRIIRTHGGAVLSKAGVVEFAYVERGGQYAPQKRAIARDLANLIKPGSTLALDNGTTTLEVAKAVVGIPGLTVLTSSLAIASVLYAHEGLETVLLGGTARKGSPDLTGWLTTENIKRFHVDYAVVGADGVTPDGAYTTAVDLARVCEAVMSAGTQAILVTDHSKIGRPSFCRYASLKQFAQIMTDEGVPVSERKWLDQIAGRVTYVSL